MYVCSNPLAWQGILYDMIVSHKRRRASSPCCTVIANSHWWLGEGVDIQVSPLCLHRNGVFSHFFLSTKIHNILLSLHRYPDQPVEVASEARTWSLAVVPTLFHAVPFSKGRQKCMPFPIYIYCIFCHLVAILGKLVPKEAKLSFIKIPLSRTSFYKVLNF